MTINIYLDHERLTYNDKTLTASQTTKFALDQFVGKCPFIIVVIKSNTSPVRFLQIRSLTD